MTSVGIRRGFRVSSTGKYLIVYVTLDIDTPPVLPATGGVCGTGTWTYRVRQVKDVEEPGADYFFILHTFTTPLPVTH